MMDHEERIHDEELEGSAPQPAKAGEEGVFVWVKKLWSDDDVGMRFFLQEGAIRVIPYNRRSNHIFDWYSYFIEEGYVERVPGSEELGELLHERAILDAKIRTLKTKLLDE